MNCDQAMQGSTTAGESDEGRPVELTESGSETDDADATHFDGGHFWHKAEIRNDLRAQRQLAVK